MSKSELVIPPPRDLGDYSEFIPPIAVASLEFGWPYIAMPIKRTLAVRLLADELEPEQKLRKVLQPYHTRLATQLGPESENFTGYIFKHHHVDPHTTLTDGLWHTDTSVLPKTREVQTGTAILMASHYGTQFVHGVLKDWSVENVLEAIRHAKAGAISMIEDFSHAVDEQVANQDLEVCTTSAGHAILYTGINFHREQPNPLDYTVNRLLISCIGPWLDTVPSD